MLATETLRPQPNVLDWLLAYSTAEATWFYECSEARASTEPAVQVIPPVVVRVQATLLTPAIWRELSLIQRVVRPDSAQSFDELMRDLPSAYYVAYQISYDTANTVFVSDDGKAYDYRAFDILLDDTMRLNNATHEVALYREDGQTLNSGDSVRVGQMVLAKFTPNADDHQSLRTTNSATLQITLEVVPTLAVSVCSKSRDLSVTVPVLALDARNASAVYGAMPAQRLEDAARLRLHLLTLPTSVYKGTEE
jgi:hypothetical protein